MIRSTSAAQSLTVVAAFIVCSDKRPGRESLVMLENHRPTTYLKVGDLQRRHELGVLEERHSDAFRTVIRP